MIEAKADLRTRVRLVEEAVRRLAERGLHPGLLAEASAAAGCSEARARIFFRRDEDLVVALQERLAAQLEDSAAELPSGTIAVRFEAALQMRLDHLAPYRRALGRLLSLLLDPESEHGVLSRRTETIRDRVAAVFEAVVLGATDAPPPDNARTLAQALYGAHLAIVLFATQDRSEGLAATRSAVGLVRDLVALVSPLAAFAPSGSVLDRATGVLSQWIEPPPDPATTEVAERVLRALFRHRRLLPDSGACAETPCAQCLALHLKKTRRFVAAGIPVHLVLPAFPAKSPSPQKVLGKLPDLGEALALEHLHRVCDEIAAIHAPGARITICSDGRVFSDLVGVSDDDVTSYGDAIAAMIAAKSAGNYIDTFCTEDLFDLDGYHAMRRHLCEHYAEPLAIVEQRARDHAHHRAMWNGMQRFLFEDCIGLESEKGKSRTQVRKECAARAYEVIQRSNAWTRVVAECFPTALRLSIHPQPPHSSKIGIRLLETADAWLTPWHGVVLERGGKHTLMPRHEAEALGARRVERNGRASHFVLDEGGTS